MLTDPILRSAVNSLRDKLWSGGLANPLDAIEVSPEMRTAPLGELGEIVSGARPKTGVAKYWDGDIPWITSADLSAYDGIYFRGKPRTITFEGLENCRPP